MPTDAIPLHQLHEGGTGGPLEELGVDREVGAPEALERVPPHALLAELEELGLVAVHAAPDPAEGDKVVTHQGLQDGVNLLVAQAKAVPQGKGAGQVGAAAGGVEHEVAGDLAQLEAGEGVLRVDGAQEVQDGRVVAVGVLDEDGGANVEEVDLGGEVVDAVGGYNGLAELAQGHEHSRQVVGAGLRQGWGWEERGRGS